MTRIKLLFLALSLLLATAGCRTHSDPGVLNTGDEAAIYAAAIRQIYHVDHSFGEPPGWPLVYVVTTTDDSVAPGESSEVSGRLSDEVQEAVAAEVEGEPFQLIWIEIRDEAPVDPTNGQVADGEGIIITLGNVHPQDDGSVQLPFFMTCGGLCGIGKTYVLAEVSGSWEVTGSIGPEIMS